MLSVKVESLSSNNFTQKPKPIVELYLKNNQTTVKEIISKAVTKQIEDFLKHNSNVIDIQSKLNSQYLSEGEIEKQSELGKVKLNKSILKKNKEIAINIDQEIKKVEKSFKNGAFKIFVDGDQFEELNDTLLIKKDSKVIFFRIIPLVGG